MLTQTLRYSHCGSDNLVSNGHAKNGRLRFRCKDCKKYGRQNPGSNAYDDKTKALILAAYYERTSLRGLTRVFGVSRNTVSAWLKKSQWSPAAGPDARPGGGGRRAGEGRTLVVRGAPHG